MIDRVLHTSPLCKKCPCSEFFWSVLSRIRTEYGDLPRKYLYSFRKRENTDQKTPEYGHFSRSGLLSAKILYENYPYQNQLF